MDISRPPALQGHRSSWRAGPVTGPRHLGMPERPPDLVLCWPGKTAAEYARVGISDYLARIRRHRSCKRVVAPEEKGNRYHTKERLEREGRALLARLAAVEPMYLVVVDPRGKQLDSEAFAALVRRQCYEDARTLAFVVGGPDGLAPAVRERADLLLGLSRMTLPHDLARLLLTEQIYRAFTFIYGLPYGR